jgi:hypothetical protein
MPRMGPFRIVVTAALFRLLSTNLASFRSVWWKAAHNFRHQAAVPARTLPIDSQPCATTRTPTPLWRT